MIYSPRFPALLVLMRREVSVSLRLALCTDCKATDSDGKRAGANAKLTLVQFILLH